MCRRGACLASESSSIPIRGPKPLSVKGALRRWKTYRGNGHNFSQPLTGEKNEVKKEKKKKRFSLYLRQVAHPAGAYPPPPPPPPNQNFIRLQHIVPARPTLEPGLLDWESSVLTIRPPTTILTKIKLVKWKNRKILVKNSWLVWRGVSFTSYNI